VTEAELGGWEPQEELPVPRQQGLATMPLSRIALLWLVGVLILVLILTSALVLWDESRFLQKELKNRSRTLATLLLTAAAEDGNPSRIPLAGVPELRWARLHGPSGDVLWQFGRPPEHSGGEPVLRLRESHEAEAGRFRLEMAVSTVRSRLHVLHSGLRLVMGLAVALAVALLVGAVLFERVSAPLNDLARRMATFEPDVPLQAEDVPAGGAREVTALALSFSAMARRLAEQRRELLENERLREAQKMEAVATLAGGIAHDFNNLLTGVMLHVRLLEQGEGDDGTVAAIRRLAEEGVQVVNELLLFARRESAPEEEIDLASLLRSQEALLQNLVPEGMILEVSAAPDPVPVRGTRVGLRRVLLNLVLNARQAVQVPGGHITVSLGSEGQEAVLRVRDNGSGIPADARDHLFEPFWSRRREGRGAGLGLAVVYSLVQQHGGRVLVDSAPGQGTCMTVRLPLAGDWERDTVEEADEVTSGLRVLLVDPDGRRAAGRMEILAGEGFELRHAPDLEGAVTLSVGWRPSVLVVAGEALDAQVGRALPAGVPLVVVGEYRAGSTIHAEAVISPEATPASLVSTIRNLVPGEQEA